MGEVRAVAPRLGPPGLAVRDHAQFHVNQLTARPARVRWESLNEAGSEPAVPPEHDRWLEICDLASGLARLPLEYREVLLLVAPEGLSYERTARVPGVPLGTVMSRLARARERLRRLMEGDAQPSLRRVK